jgi:hypothetical protein
MTQAKYALTQTSGFSIGANDTIESVVSMRWCWFHQWVRLLQDTSRHAGSSIRPFAGTSSPGGRFVAYVCPKLLGIHESTHIDLRDLSPSQVCESVDDRSKNILGKLSSLLRFAKSRPPTNKTNGSTTRNAQ